MAMGKRRREEQKALWVPVHDLPMGGGHVFYEKLDRVLRGHDFDTFVEDRCGRFYDPTLGRPSLAPGVYFRCLLIGFFEGIDSERGIAWRCADSLSLRQFLGMALDEPTPDHSTLSRTRRLMDLDTHRAVFTFALKVLAENGLVGGKTVGIDASTMEANAAMRSIVRRDTGEGYQEYLKRLAQAAGIEEPTREDLVKLDRDRPKKGSNDDWRHPHDPDAKIAKMKDGRTHLAHKIEHAVDMTPGSEGAVIAVTLQPADHGDTTTILNTVVEATAQLRALSDDEQTAGQIDGLWMSEAVVDKGYHSSEVLMDLEEMEIRSYASEPRRGRRRWKGKPDARHAVYANRRRVRGERGKKLLKRRGELVERSFAHTLDTGGMRRAHLRHRDNILKRLLVHEAGFNLSLLMRRWIGRGTPRGLQGLLCALIHAFTRLVAVLCGPVIVREASLSRWIIPPESPSVAGPSGAKPSSATGC